MPNYDFKTLSPIDFEILVRDLLQEELKIRFESFKIGKDQGIDFRYWESQDHSIIVQCKHYLESGYLKLLQQLKNHELNKIRIITPPRYILATSIGLTPNQKKEIIDLFCPLIKSPKDIYSNEDLNNLLGIYPKIEKYNFKLWFASIPILEEIIHSRIKNISKDYLEKIQAHAKYYVHNESYNDAIKILNSSHYCIIAGIPGIGKTILAEMLLLHHYVQGYEIVKINEDISEAYSLDLLNQKKIFYYDDFLGQTSLSEKLNRNEDQRLLDFIGTIRKSKTSKLILTTREYILNQARILYEKISRGKWDKDIYVIQLSKYTRMIKAKILFNHIYFSNLPSKYQNALLKNQNYLKIIDHPNYNPRIIDLMTDNSRLGSFDPSQYLDSFMSNLNNPLEIWRHSFEEQICQSSRDLLLIIGSMPDEIFLSDLEEAFNLYHQKQAADYHLSIGPQDFMHALKESDGNFITTEKSRYGIVIKFHNPSIRDFIKRYIFNNKKILNSIIDSAVYFDQLIRLWRYGEDDPEIKNVIMRSEGFIGMLRKTLNSKDCQLINIKSGDIRYKAVGDKSFEFRAFLISSILKETENKAAKELFREVINSVENRMNKKASKNEDLLILLRHLKKLNLISVISDDFLRRAKDLISQEPKWIEDVELFCDFAAEFPSCITDDDRNMFKEYLKKIVSDLPYDSSDPDFIRGDAEKLRTLSSALKIDMDYYVLKLEEEAEELEKESGPEDDYDSEFKGSYSGDYCSDGEIESLFRALADHS